MMAGIVLIERSYDNLEFKDFGQLIGLFVITNCVRLVINNT